MEDNTEEGQEVSVPAKIGRPKKRKKKVGRPKGTTQQVLAEYQHRMLSSPKSRKVMDKIFAVALDDEHSHQGAMLKLIGDRLLPLASFAPEKSGGLSGINISINTTGGAVEVTGSGQPADQSDIIEGDFTDVED